MSAERMYGFPSLSVAGLDTESHYLLVSPISRAALSHYSAMIVSFSAGPSRSVWNVRKAPG